MLELTNEEHRQLLTATAGKKKGPGRKANVPNFTPAERLFMGVRGTLESVKSVQSGMEENTDHDDVSQPTVNNAMNGMVGTRPDAGLQEALDLVLDASKTLGSGVMFKCIELITEDEVRKLKPLQKAQMAEKMSNIIKRIERDKKSDDERSKIVYTIPQESEQNVYEVIDVKGE